MYTKEDNAIMYHSNSGAVNLIKIEAGCCHFLFNYTYKISSILRSYPRSTMLTKESWSTLRHGIFPAVPRESKTRAHIVSYKLNEMDKKIPKERLLDFKSVQDWVPYYGHSAWETLSPSAPDSGNSKRKAQGNNMQRNRF